MTVRCGFRAVSAALILMMWGCGGGGGGGGGGPISPTPTATYTALVYMVGSNLESDDGSATRDLQEMMQVGSSSTVNVIVETGGASQWQNSWVSNTSVQRWRVANDGLALKATSGEFNLNMGDPATLQDFITWGVATYPADKYLLVLWDHGGGPNGGFGSDDNNGHDRLSLPELQQALRNAYTTTGEKFDVIGFDACLMATVEVASIVSPYADVLVASEETEPGHGWDYTAIVSGIRSNPAISGRALGQVIADGYQAQAENIGDAQSITLSVTDLSKIPGVIAALDALTIAAGTDLQTNGQSARIQLATGRSKTEDYGRDEKNQAYMDLADLKHLGSQLSGIHEAEASALITAINNAVVYKVNGKARPNANGLSIYFPYKSLSDPNLSTTLQGYKGLDFSSTYPTLVTEYVNLTSQDTIAPTFAGETWRLGWGGTGLLSGQVQGGDADTVEVVIAHVDSTTGKALIVGMDTVDTQDATGNVTYAWDGNWLMLNGKPISLFPESTGGTIETSSIPALLNGQDVDILVEYDTTTDKMTVDHAWPGIVDGMASRELITIKAGDVITPVFYLFDPATDTTEATTGVAFVVGPSGLELSLAPVESGTYSLGFIATDFAQNSGSSEFFTVNVPLGSPIQPPPPPSLGTWTPKSPMPTPRYLLASGVINDTLYAVGGAGQYATCCNQFQTVEAYNPAANTWTTMAPMPTGREGLAVGVVNGILYAVGGYNGGGLNTVEAYDPIANAWVTKAPMPTGRSYPSVGVINGILYVVGGSGPLVTVDAYDPATNTWTAKAPMHTARYMLGVGVVNGILYAVGGTTTGACCGAIATVEAYDPITNTWTERTPMPTPRYGLTVGVIRGTLYAIGGIGNPLVPGGPAIFPTAVEAYDPVTNTWTAKAPMSSGRFYLSSGVVGNVLYAIGGKGEILGSYTTVGTTEAFTP